MSSGASKAGIPGGMDAGERLSAPASSSFEIEEAALPQHANATVMRLLSEAPSLSRDWDKFLQSTAEVVGDRREVRRRSSGSSVDRKSDTKPRKKVCKGKKKAAGQSDEIVGAMNDFGKVFLQVEQTKSQIMKDLEARRSVMESKLTKLIDEAKEDDVDEALWWPVCQGDNLIRPS